MIKIYLLIVALTVTLIGGFAVYKHFEPSPIKVENYTEAPTPYVIERKVPKVTRQIKSIQVYDKEKLAKAETLPEEAKPENKEVVAVGEVETRTDTAIVNAVTNTETGETKLIVGHKTPFLRAEGVASLYLEGKIAGDKDLPAGRLGLQLDVARVSGNGVLYAKGELESGRNSSHGVSAGAYVGFRYEVDLF